MRKVELKGNANRAHDYVMDVERWTGHAREWLKPVANTKPDPEMAMNALSNAHAAVLAAMEYIRTGKEQHS